MIGKMPVRRVVGDATGVDAVRVQFRHEVEGRHRPVESADHPSALIGRHAVVVGQRALRRDACVVAVGGEFTHRLARQIPWRLDALGRVDEDRRVAELAGQEHRNRDERRVLQIEGPQVERPAQVGHPELVVCHHALEDVRDDAGGVEGGLHTVDLHRAVDQGTDVFVVVKADVQLDITHC
jgi:hypothetical protein